MKNVSFGLMRMIGMAGFFAVGVTAMYRAKRWFTIPEDPLFMADLKGRAVWVFIVGILSGLLGLLVGQAIGASIPVRSDKTNAILGFLWHCAANGSVAWICLSCTALGMMMGGPGLKSFWQSYGAWRLSSLLAGVGIIAGWTIGLEHFVLGPALIRGGKHDWAAFLPWILSVVTGALTGLFLGLFLHVGIPGLVVAGIALPFPLVIVTGHTFLRDRDRRRRTQHNG